MNGESKRALIVLNGEVEPTLPHVDASEYDLIVATDGAVHVLLDHDWRPSVVLGDFDSADDKVLSQAEALGIEILHTPNQDFTDFEKALQHVDALDVSDLDIIGHTGRRLDHALGAMHTAALYADRFAIRMIDPSGVGYLVPRDEFFVIEGKAGTTCSLIAVLPALVNLKGFQWPLSAAELGGNANQSISNVIVSDEAGVHVDHGVVLVYLNQ